MSATMGVSGTGSGTANPGDLGQVTATLNGRVFFQRSGVFTSLLQFLGSGAASVTLQPGANHFTVQGSAGSCSTSDSMVVYYTPPPPPEKKGSGPPRECNGSNPICGGTGNKYQREIDYVGAGPFPLRFERHYNSAWPEERALGARWRSHYDRQLATTATQAAITRPEGQAFLFKLVGGVWTPEIDVSERLERLTDAARVLIGWRYTTNTDETERYDAKGRLVSLTNRQGFTQMLAYDAEGRLATVTDPAGRTLRFTHDETQRLQTMTDPAGGVYSYRYDGNGNLASVGYPDATPAHPNDDRTRVYHYEDARFLHHLTGLTDENGSRFATWAYDAAGRAVLSEHAGGAERVTFTYHPDGSTTATDASGHTRTYAFDTLHGVQKLTSLDGGPCRNCGPQARDITYDVNGFVASRTDFNGHTTLYSHDARGLELSRTEAAGTPEERTVTTTWHPSLRVPISITEPGKEITFTYDAAGRLLVRTETDPATGATRATIRTYDLGLLESVDGPRTDVSDITRFAYDAAGDLVSVTDALGHPTQITAHDAHGRPLTIRDPNGTVTALTYDARGRLVSRTVDGQATAFDYDAAGNLVRATLPNGSFLQHTYDAAVRLIAMEDNFGNRIGYTLDALGNRIREDVKDPGGALSRTRSRVYDEMNRLVQEIGGENQTTLYAYDANGNPISITDPNANPTTQAFDALNRRMETTDALNGVTAFTYDPRDNLIAVTDPRGLTTRYAHDGLDNRVQEVSPDTGTTTYAYDAAGNRTSRTDARGVTVHYTYDALNRLTASDYPDDGLDVAFTYDTCPNGMGRLCEMRDGSGTTTYAYDPRGNLTTQSVTVGGVAQILGYAYDGADQLIRITYPSGRTVNYARDIVGRIASLTTTTLDGVNQALAGDIEYRPFGPMASLGYGNGIPLVRAFDRDHRLTAQTAGAAQALAFRLDPNGNLTGITNPLDPNRDQGFGYDALDRLTEAHGRYGEIGYIYDEAGNRVSRTRNGIPEPYTYAADSHHLLQSVEGGTRNYRYDANGNTTDNSDFEFVYGDHDRLTAVTLAGAPLATYTYNGRGERVRKVVGEDRPDYAALAAEQEALAAAHRSEAERTEAEARALEDSARASEAQAAAKQGEADTLRQAAADHRTEAEGLDRQADLREQYATPWRTLAQRFRSRIIEPPQNFIQRLLNALYRALADRFKAVADATSAEASRLRVQAEALRDAAGIEEEQAQAREAEATALLAEATEAREEAAGVRTEADAFMARAQAAEALAAEYRALAEHPPSAQIATHYLYDQAGRLLGEYDEEGHVQREYVYLEGMPLALIAPNGVYYYHTDHLGTPGSLTDQDQAIVWQAHHDPFGRASVTTQAVVNNLRFPGQYFDAETGLHYNYFRDYDPSLGRYIQSDPIGLAGRLNTYSYVTNNPLNLIDPQGLLFGGLIDAGESYGDSSAQYWADRATQSGNPLYHVPGALAALWTPDTSDATAATLVCGAGIARYLARPFWQYYPLENPGYSSPWLTRGWGWKPPYAPGPQAAERLSLPPHNPGTVARPVNLPSRRPVRGPRPVEPQFGHPGGGWEYKRGWRW